MKNNTQQLLKFNGLVPFIRVGNSIRLKRVKKIAYVISTIILGASPIVFQGIYFHTILHKFHSNSDNIKSPNIEHWII